MATQDQINDLTALYVGYFDRAPDPAGLQFWIDQIDAGREFNTIAEDFAGSPEAIELYPYLATPGVSTPAAFITSVYANLFNRVPDAAGLTFWTGVLQDGSVSVADMIEAIINGAVDGSVDKAILDNKVAVGFDFATKTANIPGFEFDAAAKAAAVAVLDGVTDDAASVDAAIAETDAFVAAGVGGDTFTLTPGIDFADVDGSGRGGPFWLPDTGFEFTGANETVNASQATLDNSDVLLDGSTTDNDKLNVSITGNANVVNGATVGNIENVNFNLTNGFGNLTLANYTGVNNLKVSGSVTAAGIGIGNIGNSGVSNIDLTGITSTDNVGFDVSLVAAGADQDITVTAGDLNNLVVLGDGDNSITTGAGNDFIQVGIGANTIDAGNGINTVVVLDDGDATTIDGNNTITTGTGVDAVFIQGDGNNTVSTGAAGDSVSIFGDGNNTIDTGAGADNVFIDVTAAGNNSVTTGEGADIVTVDGTGNNIIMTGAGNDLITLNATATGSNVITAGAGADTIILNGTGPTDLVFAAGDSGLTLLTIDNVQGFLSGTDDLDFNSAAGSAANFSDAGAVADFDAALAAANATFTASLGAVEYVFADDAADGWVFHDADGNGEADMAIQLTGVTAIVFGDIIA